MLNRRIISTVQADWARVVPIAEQAATLFYERVFELEPSLRPLFKSDLSEQKLKLLKMIGATVSGLDDLAGLLPTVQALGQRHVGYGVRAEHYVTIGSALLWTLKQGLGDAFGRENELAWIEVYGLLADTMKEASQPLTATT